MFEAEEEGACVLEVLWMVSIVKASMRMPGNKERGEHTAAVLVRS